MGLTPQSSPAMAPAGCPEEMANELRRCVKELGFKASHLVPYIGRRNVDHPSFYPYYQAAEELGVKLAQRGTALIYGGATMGLMGAVANATLKHGGRVLGATESFSAFWDVIVID